MTHSSVCSRRVFLVTTKQTSTALCLTVYLLTDCSQNREFASVFGDPKRRSCCAKDKCAATGSGLLDLLPELVTDSSDMDVTGGGGRQKIPATPLAPSPPLRKSVVITALVGLSSTSRHFQIGDHDKRPGLLVLRGTKARTEVILLQR